jgi:hypothetical protein
LNKVTTGALPLVAVSTMTSLTSYAAKVIRVVATKASLSGKGIP